jgi:hypothetical protein
MPFASEGDELNVPLIAYCYRVAPVVALKA